MRLSDLLLSAKIITQADLEKALARQREEGGGLADQLIAIGAVTSEALEKAASQIPSEPESFADTGITATELMTLMLKLIHTARLETVAEFTEAIKLPPQIVGYLVQAAISRSLMVALGSSGHTMRYELSEQGRMWAQEALKASLYAGPAPVTLDDFCARVKMQKITNETITYSRIRTALEGYSITDELIRQIGPALNSGRAMLLYGPPGNGKTSITQCFANVFDAVIYVPYAVMIDGQIMRVFDPSMHIPINNPGATQSFSALRREQYDARWVAIRRPFIVAGGELTLEMLDLRYDAVSGFYEAPLHIKALGGCFVIDDFGRQIVSPTTLLNRWIVPMESRVDYLKLHTGKSFSIPFEALVIFSTNLDPEDLMDPAFLRRLPYKIEVGAPSLETYVAIFQDVCKKSGVPLNEEALKIIVHKVKHERGLEFAAFHARFIIDQVLAIARFMGEPPRIDKRSVDYALRNLSIRKQAGAAGKAN